MITTFAHRASAARVRLKSVQREKRMHENAAAFVAAAWMSLYTLTRCVCDIYDDGNVNELAIYELNNDNGPHAEKCFTYTRTEWVSGRGEYL